MTNQQCGHLSAWVAERMPCPWCQQAEIERLRGLLRRALPDLKWAESAADQEYSSSLNDMEIIRDIEAALPEGAGTSG